MEMDEIDNATLVPFTLLLYNQKNEFFHNLAGTDVFKSTAMGVYD